MRRRLILGAGVVAVLGLFLLLYPRSADDAVRSLADAWEAHDWARLDELAGAESELAKRFERTHTDLGVTETAVEPGPVGAGMARLRVTQTLGGIGDWSYETEVEVADGVLRDGIRWEPSILHPALREGLALRRSLTWPARAPIVGHDAQRITIDGTLVAVGLEPRRIEDRGETLAALEEQLGLDPGAVAGELDRPGVQPDWFVPLVRLREEPYEEMRPDLAPIPGVVFRREEARLTPAEGFAEHVVGTTGEVTAELLEDLGPPYEVGDVVGRSGLELAFERRLAGAPAAEIRLVDAEGETVEVLHTLPGREAEAVRTTIDPDVQTAAEAAMAGVETGALVALDAETGEIRAALSRPLDAPFDRALAGRYPPGSTFKIVTAAALLSAEGAGGTISCPAEVTVGRPFRNAEGRALGDVGVRTAFVESCNTAFVRITERLGAERLVATARTSFGFGADYDFPLPVAGGRFPEPGDAAGLAAAGIGQGRVEASPLHMASVAATVAADGWRAPSLLEGDAAPDPSPIDSEVAATLREWMRGVVAEGTGTAADVPGADVRGKTGTAEFGTGDDRGEHAWFVGFHGTLAFAVLLEGGGAGGEAAAPIAADFVRGLG